MFCVINITDRGCHISVSEGRVAIQKKGIADPLLTSLIDIDAVVIEESAVSFSGAVLTLLAEHRIPVIFCDRKHLPVSTLQPIYRSGSEPYSLLSLQFHSTEPWKKRIWQKLVRHKTTGQAVNLYCFTNSKKLFPLIKMIRSGDPDNIEARASAIYWRELNLFPRRGRFYSDANSIFNYAYTILYAAFGRTICAASLNPAIGIHHHNQYDHFALASDLMEPYRPLVDRCVIEIVRKMPEISSLTGEVRKELLQSLYLSRVTIEHKNTNLFTAVETTVHSYKRCLKNKTLDLSLPEVN